MKITKQALSDLFKRYSTVMGQMDSHYKLIQKRYLEKYNLSGRYYLEQIQDIDEDYVIYRVQDSQGDMWPYHSIDGPNQGITVEELCMDQEQWNKHVIEYRAEFNRKREQKIAKSKKEQAIKDQERKYNEYLKLKSFITMILDLSA